ncbi:MAG TPA: hypothetical protein VJA23_03645 [Candidatus Nanoarchaeia archaeon]|nr:hypothetical protein [Candidatus Nanoarchaeia archaeon]
MIGEKLRRNQGVIWGIREQNSPVESDAHFSKNLEAAVKLCEAAEDYQVHFLDHEWSSEVNLSLFNHFLRWGVKVEFVFPDNAEEPDHNLFFYQCSIGYGGRSNAEGRSEQYSLGRKDVLEAVRDWQNQPGFNFTQKEMFAYMDLQVAAGKYWNLERRDALPLSPKAVDKAKSMFRWLVEKYPLFEANEGLDVYNFPGAQFDLNYSKFSSWKTALVNCLTQRVLEVTFDDERSSVYCYQYIYPPLEQLGRGIVTSRHGFPEMSKGQRPTITKLDDLVKYVDWVKE